MTTKKPRSAQTAKTMAWLSGIVVLVGLASPATKAVAVVLLLSSAAMAVSLYPQYQQEIGRMHERAAKPR